MILNVTAQYSQVVGEACMVPSYIRASFHSYHQGISKLELGLWVYAHMMNKALKPLHSPFFLFPSRPFTITLPRARP